MFVQAVDPTSTSFQVGQWAGGLIVIGLGVLLVVMGERKKSATQQARGGGMFGWGIGVIVLGAAMFAVQVLNVASSAGDDVAETTPVDERVSTTLLTTLRDHLLADPIRVVSTSQAVGLEAVFVGDDAAGTQTEGEATLRFVKIADEFYIRPNEAFWKVVVGDDARAVTEALGSQWVLLDPNQTNLAFVTPIGDRVQAAQRAIPVKGVTTRREPASTIRGVECTKIRGAKGSAIYFAKDTKKVMRFVDSKGAISDVFYDGVETPAAPRKFVKESDIIEAG